jgi:hypothetical protein
MKLAHRGMTDDPCRPPDAAVCGQEDAVKEIIGTQPLNLKTYFLTIDTPHLPPTHVESTHGYLVGIDPP